MSLAHASLICMREFYPSFEDGAASILKFLHYPIAFIDGIKQKERAFKTCKLMFSFNFRKSLSLDKLLVDFY